MSEPKLLPCPFCGGKAETKKSSDEEFYVTCEHEDCYAYQMTDGEFGYVNLSFMTERESIEVWNRRAK